MPSADNLQLGIYAVLNEEEAASVGSYQGSTGSSEGKRVKLGNPQLAELNRNRKRAARNFADQHSKLIWSLRNKARP